MPGNIANAQGTPLQQSAAQYGWMQGTKARIQDELSINKDIRDTGYLGLAQNEDARAEKDSSMKQEAFGWKREDRQRDQMIQQGIAQAGQEGGYEGVIDYLKQADPERAIDFTNKKLALDRNMMTTDTMKALAPSQQAAAMVEGYGIFGRMSQALLQAPEEDRDGMYKHILPILKQVNPYAPEQLDHDAKDMLLLGAAQYDPNSRLFSATKELNTFNTKLGQMTQDAAKAAQLYGSNDPKSIALQQAVLSAGENNGMTAAQAAALQLKQQGDQVGGETALRNEFGKNNANFTKVANFYQQTMQSIKDSKDPMTGKVQGPNDIGLIYNVAHMLNPQSMLKPGAIATLENTGGWSDEARQQYNKVLNGQKLTPEERDAYAHTATGIYEANKRSYDTMKAGYQDIVTQNGYRPQQVFVNSTPLTQLDTGPKVPDDLQRMAEQAVAQGADPKAVNARMQQIVSQRAQPPAQGIPNAK